MLNFVKVFALLAAATLLAASVSSAQNVSTTIPTNVIPVPVTSPGPDEEYSTCS
jgi:hypothetical protein